MDIRNWQRNKIMQLPDWCLGERYPVGCMVQAAAASSYFFMANFKFPERCIIWAVDTSFQVRQAAVPGAKGYYYLKLGNRLMVASTEFPNFEDLLPQCGLTYTGARRLVGELHLHNLKSYLLGGGRTLTGYWVNGGGEEDGLNIIVTISSVPVEIPDWVLTHG
jgi:hypothetical protein